MGKAHWFYGAESKPSTPDEYGLFVWRGDGRYKWSDSLRRYKVRSAAEKEAEKMNARGEHGGNVVVRTRSLVQE